MAPGCEYYLDTFSSLRSPPRRVIFRADGAEWAVFVEADRKPLEEYDLRPAEIVEVKASDGSSAVRAPDPARGLPARGGSTPRWCSSTAGRTPRT